MITFDDVTGGNITVSPNRLHVPDHLYRIIIIRGSGSGKTNALLNLTNYRPDIDKEYLYAKYQYEAKYQFLKKTRENLGLKHYKDPKALTEYSNGIQDTTREKSLKY